MKKQAKPAKSGYTPVGRDRVRNFAPKLMDLTEGVLFGDVWKRPGLSPRDRSLITVAAIVALSRTQQMVPNMKRALANGVTKEELAELVTHLAFYAGWPAAITAGGVAADMFAEIEGGSAGAGAPGTQK